MSENEKAFKDLIEMAARNQWWATHTALTEDGYDPAVDWVKMREDWKKDDRGDACSSS